MGPSPQPGGLWFALRITPGADPARDPWRFESGPLGGRPFECTPTREAAGIRLGSCGPNPAWPDFALSLPDVGAGEEARLVVRGGGGQATVTRAWVRDEPQASPNVTLLWHHEARDLGSHGDVWSDGDVVIATHSSGWIELLDAETGAVRGRVDARVGFAAPGYGNGITDAKTRDGTLYLGTDARGVLIFDIRDRASPRFLGQYAVPHGSAPVPFVNVHNMYLAPDAPLLVAINTSYEQTDLRLIDVADPIAPREAGRFQLPTGSTFSEGVHDVHVVVRDGRRIAYVHAMLNGFLVLDVSDPAAIRTLGSITWEGIFSHSGWAFGAGGRHYYAHNDEGPDQGMTVIDVTDLARPRVVSRFSTRKGISVHDVEVHDGIAYVAYYIDGLRAVDLRDPARPREVAHFDTVPASREADVLQGAWSVHVARGRVFVSDMETGVYAFRVTVP
ncbi:MAG: hypothetical protein FJZ92_08970 [Chloroflexi bacterium]|nr:hypothetical protein [Chloroflexota bacterium]